MSWIAVGVGGATVVGGGLGFLAGKKKKVDPYGTLNPEQRSLTKALGPYFQGQLENDNSYGGELNARIGQGELDNIESYNRLNALRNNSLSSIFTQDPQALNEEFDNQVAKPTYDYFSRNVQPLIEESLPTFSTARGQVVGRNLADITGNLATQRFNAQQTRREQILGASGALDSSGAVTQGINAIPREIQQAGYDRQYQSFVQGNQEKQNSINQMLSFLNLSTGTRQEDTRTQTAIAGAQAGGGLLASVLGGGGATPKA